MAGTTTAHPGPDLKRYNVARCAIHLRDEGQGTVAGVAGGTGLSRPTVDNALSALIADGLVESVSEERSARQAGRPARRFRFRGESRLVVGVDVGIHRIRAIVSTLDGRVVAYREVETIAPIDGAMRLRAVIDDVDAALADAGADRAAVVMVGVAVPGLVDERGTILLSHLLPDWEGTSIAARLADEFGSDVIIDNDVRLATLAEHRLGAARLADDVAYFSAGHRVSMGLVLGGEIRRGRHSAAGEIGDSAFGTRTTAGGELIWDSAPTGEEVFALAAAGDAAAQDEVDAFVRGLARGIAPMTLAIDPDVVIVGGGMSRAGDRLIAPLRRAIRDIVHIPVELTVLASVLGAESVVMGALLRAFALAQVALYGVEGLPEPRIDHSLITTGRNR